MWAHRSQGALKKFPELQIGKHFWWKEYCCKFSQFDTVSATSLKTFWNPSALMMMALLYTPFLEKCEFVSADPFCAWRWRAQYGLTHISAGDLLRAEVAAGTDSGNKAQEYMQKGMLVPDEIVVTVCVFTVFVLLLGSTAMYTIPCIFTHTTLLLLFLSQTEPSLWCCEETGQSLVLCQVYIAKKWVKSFSSRIFLCC